MSVVGVRSAETTQHINIAYFRFDDKKLADANPNLDSKKIISGYSKIIPKLNIKEVKKPELNAYLVAENIAQQLVKRIGFRKTMKRAMQSALRLGAKGIKVCLSGRLAGNEIARTEWLREGSVPLHTFRAEVDYGETEALTAYGIIGVKVWIYKGEIFLKDLNKNNKEIKNATTDKNKV